MPEEVSFQGHARPLPSKRAAAVLVPLCGLDLARPVPGRSVVQRAWAALQEAGFRQYVPFVRGDDIVIVLAEGVVSWPIQQLTPDAVDFLEVQAL